MGGNGRSWCFQSQDESLGSGRLSHGNRPAFLIFPRDQALPGHFCALRVAQWADFTYTVGGPESLKEPIQVVDLL